MEGWELFKVKKSKVPGSPLTVKDRETRLGHCEDRMSRLGHCDDRICNVCSYTLSIGGEPEKEIYLCKYP